MNVVVTCSHHFDRTPDGRVWTNGTCPYVFWTRYLPVFKSVRVVARMREVSEIPPGREPADGPGVSFFPIHDYVGPEQFLLRAPGILAVARKAFHNGDALIFRAPSLLGDSMVPGLRRTNRPYGVEVVTDPYDAFSPNAIKHPFRPFFRWWFTRALKRQCANACAAAYVTERALQRRYPPAPHAFTTHYSSIDLPGTAFVEAPRTTVPNGSVRLILIGTLAQLYKGPDVLIDAVGACVHEGLNIELVFVGSGRYQSQLEAQVAALDLQTRVQFCGQVASAEAVRAELDRADLFVLPSRQEGLPRAMIEAMARGLPCIGSSVGGTPELLAAEDMVPPNDASALARKIREVLADPSRLARMSVRNLEKAREYSLDILTCRRERFYGHVRAQTEAWLKQSLNKNAITNTRHLDSRLERTRTHFANPSPYLTGNYNISLRARIVKQLLGRISNCRILDLGCGDGTISLQFLAANNHITLVDSSDGMLERAKRNTPNESVTHVDYMCRDIFEFNPDARFDVVFCIGVLAHINSTEGAIAKVAGHLKPGGRCIFQITDDSQLIHKVNRWFYSVRAAIREFFGHSPLKLKRMSLADVVAIASRNGLKLVAKQRHRLMLFPGMSELLGRRVIPYDLFVQNRPWLSRHSEDVILLFVKCEQRHL